MAENDKSFLGKGWGFPPSFESDSYTVKMVEGIEDINQSLKILISTSFGERIKREDYGTGVNEFVFEPSNVTNQSVLKDGIEKSILLYESRIRVEKIILESVDTEGLLMIDIRYVVKATNTRNNFVYPFYLKEGINL